MSGPPTTIDELKAVTAYQRLLETVAVRSVPLVAVVGAGLSAPSGLPSWDGLRAHLVKELRQKAARSDPTTATKLAEEADQIARTSSYWVAFDRLEKQLGRTTYREEIRALLSPGDTAPIPSAYLALWKSPVKGILNLNLDTFSRRAFSEARPGTDLKHFIGRDAARLRRLLNGAHRYSISLHGTVDDAESWVFTNSALKGLFATSGYEDLLRTIFSTHTVLFLGVSADDIAIGGPLERLARLKIEGPSHYWLTARTDGATDRWAEDVGIRILPYASSQGDHVIVEKVLLDLAQAVAPEIVAPPVLFDSGSQSPPPLESPDLLVTRPLEEIRLVLNTRAVELLEGPGGEGAFDEFVEEYDEPIHRAWYTSAKRANETLFGYTLLEQVARGAFGRVFRALDREGNLVAVKVLLTEIRSEVELLHSFRRGVRAMRILEEHRVSGMVGYRDASEIPAFVTMEWIEGPNLKEAKEAGYIRDWDTILWVAAHLVRVIKGAHSLPEGVLHRDIRPANIMLRNGWVGTRDDWELVVLDFDLSTFRGARQRSVLAEGSALGFLAPEQLDPSLPFSTRNAAVDSFGLGMTLYFLCSGHEPEAYLQRRTGFREQLREASRRPSGVQWRSLPTRFARLIEGATADTQPQRLDVAEMQRELDRLQRAQDHPGGVTDADLLCEELASRCDRIPDDYAWDSDIDSVLFSSPSGLRIAISGPVETEALHLSMSWASTGLEDRSRLGKYIPERASRASAALRSTGWERIEQTVERHSLLITARLSTRGLAARLDKEASALGKALDALTFSDL